LHRGRTQQFFDLAATFRAGLLRLIRELLDLLEAMAALLALILVKRHRNAFPNS
jgi:hypothetical protein